MVLFETLMSLLGQINPVLHSGSMSLKFGFLTLVTMLKNKLVGGSNSGE